MINLKNIEFKGYKSFTELTKLEEIGNVNLIIGKNNSGKSSILDVIEYIFMENGCPKDGPEKVYLTQILTEKAIRRTFRKDMSSILGGLSSNISDYDYGMKFKDEELCYRLMRETIFETTANELELVSEFAQGSAKNNFKDAAGFLYSPLPTPNVRKVNAERNIVPELQQPLIDFDVESDGGGATSIICNYLNDSKMDETLIEDTLLNAFNQILGEDAQFSAIKVQQIGDDPDDESWEIFLTENRRKYALSKMGSGLRTVLLVLINLLIPPREKKHRVFLFEELENNLHPALQRRLFNFIYDFATENDVMVFITTHSHVAINCYFEKESANIYHVEKTNGISTIKKIKDYISKSKLLDDLDVRASDLLQSNGIIWVEGPSDRIYIKKWLSLVDPSIKENEHYQFVYYGGKLLSHYTADSNEEKNLLNILLTNRHSAIVIDSDKRSEDAEINDTKKRVQSEFEQNNSFCWITQGKEIENYLSCGSLNEKFSSDLAQIEQYELFPDYIEKQYHNFSAQKVAFAQELCDYIKEEHLNVLDLKEKTENLVTIIKQWNRLT